MVQQLADGNSSWRHKLKSRAAPCADPSELKDRSSSASGHLFASSSAQSPAQSPLCVSSATGAGAAELALSTPAVAAQEAIAALSIIAAP